MNSKLLHSKVKDSFRDGVNVNSLNQVRSHLREYAISHCYHPVKMWVYDSSIGKKVLKELPCGTCYHCRTTKVNGWVTRLYAHLEDYKYCYFVTLTYRSFTEKELSNPINLSLVNRLSDCIWLKDSDNFTKVPTYSPCLVSMKHFSAFMKRLRSATKNNTITFFATAEYGHEYGRPHYHALLFSNIPISHLSIYRAWGAFLSPSGSIARNSKDKHFKVFGRIQFDNLVENGTIGKNEINVDGQKMTAHSCFAYVAKYCGKLEFNKCRIIKAYNYLYNIKKSFQYDYKTLQGDVIKLGLNDENLLSFKEFCRKHSPRINCSRGVPIGSRFVARHIKEMASGVFAVPPLQKDDGKTCITPAYFYRKAKEYIFSLRFNSVNGNLCKGCLPQFVQYISNSLEKEFTHSIRSNFVQIRDKDYSSAFIVADLHADYSELIRHYSITDVYDRSKYLLLLRNNVINVLKFRFSRSLSDYVQVGEIPFVDFCNTVFTQIDAYYSDYNKLQIQSKRNLYFLNKLREQLSILHQSDLFNDVIAELENNNDSFDSFYNVKRFQNSKL